MVYDKWHNSPTPQQQKKPTLITASVKSFQINFLTHQLVLSVLLYSFSFVFWINFNKFLIEHFFVLQCFSNWPFYYNHKWIENSCTHCSLLMILKLPVVYDRWNNPPTSPTTKETNPHHIEFENLPNKLSYSSACWAQILMKDFFIVWGFRNWSSKYLNLVIPSPPPAGSPLHLHNNYCKWGHLPILSCRVTRLLSVLFYSCSFAEVTSFSQLMCTLWTCQIVSVLEYSNGI